MAALYRKRAHLAGEIEALQRDIARKREYLERLDAVILLFEPTSSPEKIAAIRPLSRRNVFFHRNELTRLCLGALREIGKPAKAREIAVHAMAAKGVPLDKPLVTTQIVAYARVALTRLERRAQVRRIVREPDTWWELVKD